MMMDVFNLVSIGYDGCIKSSYLSPWMMMNVFNLVSIDYDGCI